MDNHERFEELTAIGSVGQLSSDESRELDEHLKGCPDCCRLQEEYSRIILDELPRAEAILRPGRTTVSQFASEKDLLDRFLSRAHAEGIEFPRDVGRPRVCQTRSWQRNWQWLAAAIAILTLITVGAISNGRVFGNFFLRSTFLHGPHCQECSSSVSHK